MTGILFSSFIISQLRRAIEFEFSQVYCFVHCWDTPSEETGLWQLPKVCPVSLNKFMVTPCKHISSVSSGVSEKSLVSDRCYDQCALAVYRRKRNCNACKMTVESGQLLSQLIMYFIWRFVDFSFFMQRTWTVVGGALITWRVNAQLITLSIEWCIKYRIHVYI